MPDIIRLSEEGFKNHSIKKSASAVNQGQLLIFPTDTVYGLGGNVFNEDLVRRVFKVKERDKKKPLPVLIAEQEQLEKLVSDLSETGQRLISKFWPGPLTLVLRKSENVSDLVTGGENTVGIRMPDHKICLALIRSSGVPLVAPSANIEGHPPPNTSSAVDDRVLLQADLVIDSGQSKLGISSTVVSVVEDSVSLIREGPISKKMIEETLSVVIK